MIFSAFLSFFLIIFSLVFTRAVRSALVILDHGSAFLPYLWVIAGVAILLYMLVYNNILRRYSPRKVLYSTIALFAVTLALIIRLVAEKTPGSSIILYVWSDLMSVVLTEQIWAMTHDRFEARKNSWFYAFMGSGLVLGGVVSGSLTHTLAEPLGSTGLLWISFAGLLGLLITAFFIPKVGNAENHLSVHAKNETRQAFENILSSRYLKFFLLMVLLGQIVSNLIDLAYTQKVGELYATTADRTKFIGGFTAILSSFSVAMLYIVAPLLYRFTNPLNGLLILPLSNLVGAALSATTSTGIGGWPTIFATKLFDKGLNYSIQRSSKEILYRRTSRQVKYRVKTILDVFVYRVSELVAGVLTIPILGLVGMGGVWAFCIALILIHLAIVYKLARMKPEYIEEFPDPESADADGVVCIGGQINVENYLAGYRRGIFPWPPHKQGLTTTWFCPPQRLVLFLDKLKMSKTLAAFVRKAQFEITFDERFEDVIRNCSTNRPNSEKTWMTGEVISTYTQMHKLGYCHSLEIWKTNETGTKELVAGLFFTIIDGTVAMESSFTFVDSGGKYAVVKLAEHLKSKGFAWVDLQIPSKYLIDMGASVVERSKFLELLSSSKSI